MEAGRLLDSLPAFSKLVSQVHPGHPCYTELYDMGEAVKAALSQIERQQSLLEERYADLGDLKDCQLDPVDLPNKRIDLSDITGMSLSANDIIQLDWFLET